MDPMQSDDPLSFPESAPRTDEPEVKRVRRNGIKSSCEFCRKSKLACDHEHPCSRCVRRGRKDECFYHPCPMSKPNNVSDSSVSTVPVSKEPLVPSTPEKATPARPTFEPPQNKVGPVLISSYLPIAKWSHFFPQATELQVSFLTHLISSQIQYNPLSCE